MNTLRCLESTSIDESANEPLDESQRRIELQGFLVAHYDRLLQKLTRQLCCRDLARECLHDAWLRLDDMDVRLPVKNPEAYVFRMACNVAVDRMRSNRSWQYTCDADTELEQIADHVPGPEGIVEARSELAAVERTLQQLPRHHRTVLLALRVEEVTREEVAERIDFSLRRVDTVLRQALDHCARYVERPVSADGSDFRPSRRLRAQR
jgi:RNA polymerase sigma-70 factor (ECF subfamily)